jgi:hypothetical protein
MVNDDPILTNPDFYRILWENDLVRVLEYNDEPGEQTTPHEHPNSVMVTLSAFSRRLSAAGREFDVTLDGLTPTRSILIELKGEAAGTPGDRTLGPE